MSTKKFVARHGLDANFNTISNVADPVNSSDVATKSVTDVIDTKAGLAFDTANTGVSIAQAAFDSSNNVGPQVEPAHQKANAAYNTANVAWDYANSGISIAQAAYGAANNVGPQIEPAHQKANAAYSTANNAWVGANNSYIYASSTANNAYNTANVAWAYANSGISIAQAAYTAANTKFNSSGGTISGSIDIAGSLTVEGNFTVSGNVTSVSANNLTVQDNMIYLNDGAANNANPDLGIAGAYNDGTYHHTGIFRDATDGYWKVFDNYQPEPDASIYIDTSHASFRVANFRANTFVGDLFSGSGASLTSIPNSALNNSSVTINGTAISLGGSGTVTAAAGTLTGSTLASGVTASSLTSVGTITSGTWSGSFGAVSGANLTGLTAGNLSGTIPSAVLGNSTHYVGTTAIALNRASGSQTLTGVSIDGSASELSIPDLRSTSLTPSYFGQGINGAFMSNSTDGLSDGGTYHGIIHFQQWTDSSGGGAHELGFTNNNNIWHRGSSGALTTWSSWYKLLDSSNYTSYAMPAGASATNSVDVRAPIFYDSNNTGYYWDGASTSKWNESNQNGWHTFNNYGLGITGTYDSYKLQTVFAMGSAYRMAADGASAANMYGVAWSHPNAGALGGANNLNDHGLLIINAGSFRAALSSRAVFSADVRGTLFYDYNNTAYYVDPASVSYLYGLTLAGGSYFKPTNWIQFDGTYGCYWPTNAAHIHANDLSSYGGLAVRGSRNGWRGLHFYDGGNTPHLMFDGSANGGIYYESGGRWASYYSYGNNCWGLGTSSTNSAYNLYAPTGLYSGGRVDGTIFYDSNNTGYYLDPNSTSNLYDVNMHYGHCGNFAGTTANGTATSQLQVQNASGTGDNDVAAISFHCGGYYGAKLHLRHDSYFGVGGWSAATWRWYVQLTTGNMTAAGNITAYSDPRLKEDITPITSAVEKIKQLNGMKFKWIDSSVIGHPGEYDYGILSNEVQEIAPEIVVDSVFEAPEGDKYKTVAYDKLIPFLIEAIKEQQIQIEQQSNEINKLKDLLKVE